MASAQTTPFQLTSAVEIFIDNQASTTPSIDSSPTTRTSALIAEAGLVSAAAADTTNEFESNSSQTRIATSKSVSGNQIPQRDFVLVVTLVGGVLLAVALALVILVIIQMKKIKREKQRHNEEMRRTKEVYENRLSQFSMSAIAVDETNHSNRIASTTTSPGGNGIIVTNQKIIPGSDEIDENLNIVDNSDLLRVKQINVTYYSSPNQPQASDFAVISGDGVTSGDEELNDDNLNVNVDDIDDDEEDNLSMRF